MGLLELLKGQANTPTQNQMRELEESQRPGASVPPKPRPAEPEDSEAVKEARYRRALAEYERRHANDKKTGPVETTKPKGY
jgi:hypothetical protein